MYQCVVNVPVLVNMLRCAVHVIVCWVVFSILFRFFFFGSLLFCLENWTNGNKPVPYTNVIAIITVIINRWHLVDGTTQAQKAHYPSTKRKKELLKIDTSHAVSLLLLLYFFFLLPFVSTMFGSILARLLHFWWSHLMKKKIQWNLIDKSFSQFDKQKINNNFFEKVDFFSFCWKRSTFFNRIFVFCNFFLLSFATGRMQDYRKAIKRDTYKKAQAHQWSRWPMECSFEASHKAQYICYQ